MTALLAEQRLRLLTLLTQREQARALLARTKIEVAEARGIIAALEHIQNEGRAAPEAREIG